MSALKGTVVLSPVVPTDTQDTYPTHINNYGKGGYKTAQTRAEALSIPVARLEAGTLCYIVSEDTEIRWTGTNWININNSKMPTLFTDETYIVGNGFVLSKTPISGFVWNLVLIQSVQGGISFFTDYTIQDKAVIMTDSMSNYQLSKVIVTYLTLE